MSGELGYLSWGVSRLCYLLSGGVSEHRAGTTASLCVVKLVSEGTVADVLVRREVVGCISRGRI